MQRQRSSSLCVLALKRKWVGNFFLKEFKKNTETTEQEQDISLSSKEIISPEPFAFKGFPFPTNTMTKNPASVSHLKLKTNWITNKILWRRVYHQGVTKMNSQNQTLLANQQEQYCIIRMAMAKWQPNGKTHFTEKPGKNVVNTSKYGPSSKSCSR